MRLRRPLKYALTMFALCVACGVLCVQIPFWPVRILLLWVLLAFGGVGAAYAGIGPKLFGKRTNGTLSPVRFALFWPYHALNAVGMNGFRRSGTYKPFVAIVEYVFLGALLRPQDAEILKQHGVTSVLDLTAEFSEVQALREIGTYRCLPTLDTLTPTTDALREAAGWIFQQRERGKVYIHCALGHGRSATVVVAYLLRTGEAASSDEAVAFLRILRPGVGLSAAQWLALKPLETNFAGY